MREENSETKRENKCINNISNIVLFRFHGVILVLSACVTFPAQDYIPR